MKKKKQMRDVVTDAATVVAAGDTGTYVQ